MIVCHFVLNNRYVRLLACPSRAIAYQPDTRQRVDLPILARYGLQTAPPPGPLEPRPLSLGYRLVQCWLPEGEWHRWRMAGVIPAGQRAMIKRLEEEILKLESNPDFADLLVDPDEPKPRKK